jgi:hypothetical protein
LWRVLRLAGAREWEEAMPVIHSENPTHRANMFAAEATRQLAMAGATTPAAAKAADITFYRAARASALANNCGVTTFVNALRELGVGGV